MGRPLKRSKKARESDSESEYDENMLSNGLTVEEEEVEDDGFESEDEDMSDDNENDDDDDENEDESEDDDNGSKRNTLHDEAEMDELENEYMSLQNQQQGILSKLKSHKDEDVLKGQAVKNQKALWDKTLEFRFLLQKAFSSSNRLPQDPIKSLFCESDESVNAAYSELIASSTKTLDSLLELEEALLEKSPSILQPTDDIRHGKQAKHSQSSESSDTMNDKEWSRISEMQGRISAFRDKSIDKWQRKSQVATGAAAIKGKLHAFNQNISEQVSTYMRDPSRMIKQMQLRKSTVAVFGAVPDGETIPQTEEAKPDSVAQADGDPELLDDSDFYQQLLKEFFENIDPASNEAAMYALKRYQTKKRKLVDRRASKGRKIRYHAHEKIVNFMTRQPPPKNNMPSALGAFNNLFLSKTLNTATAE